jgi:SpoVK/Ycf46/Vps4 family AAA+-type ATPase
MPRHRSRPAANKSDIEPIVRLWLLRILVGLNGHRRFVHREGFEDDSIAEALGLGHWVKPDESEFQPRIVLAELRKLHRAMEDESHGRARVPEYLNDNIRRLSKLVGLSQTDCRVLEFAVLINAERLLDEVADWLGTLSSAKVFQALAVILQLPESSIRTALNGRAILARSGLLAVDSHGNEYLSGRLNLLSHDFSDQMISAVTDPVDLLRGTVSPAGQARLGLTDYRHAHETLDILLPYLRHATQARQAGVNIFIHGTPGTGKTELARALAHALRCELFEVSGEDENGDPITGLLRLRAFRAAQALFSQRQALIVFDEVEDVFADGDGLYGRRSTAQQRKSWINRMLEENPVPTLWLSNSADCLDPAFIRRFDMVFELPIPPRKQRLHMLRETCRDLLDTATAARISGVEALAPAVVAKAASVVRAIGGQFDAEGKTKALVQLIGNTLEAQGHGRPLSQKPNQQGMYDPALTDASADLEQLAEGLNRARSGRLCLYGPPGTGKTAFALWLAERLEMPLLVRRGSDLLGPYVGQTERNIACAFRTAEQDQALLLIDEIDSFLQAREGASRNWEVSLVNEMLTQMEAYSGVFVASTNLMENLDQAALRRFDFKVEFGYLQPGQARALLARYCEALGLAPADDATEQAIASLGRLTPGDFAAVLRRHRFHPISSTEALAASLQAECALKGEPARTIGFLH